MLPIISDRPIYHLVGEKDDFKVWFNPSTQEYHVTKGSKVLVKNKWKFEQVKSYLD